MFLKRLWAKDKDGKPTAVKGVHVLRSKAVEHWSPKLVQTGIAEGWLAAGAGKFTVTGDNQTIEYRVIRGPGTYSCFTGEKLEGEVDAKAHVAKVGKGKPSPDPTNPAGYRVDNFYTVVTGKDYSEISNAEIAKMLDSGQSALHKRLAERYRRAS